MRTYKHLRPYETPCDYFGVTWHGWFAVAGQSRDSDALEQSNYQCILKDLRKLNTELPEEFIIDNRDDIGESTVTDTRCSHWAVGWVETIYVHSSNTAACERADEILGELADYPVFDEDDFSRIEDEQCAETWTNCYDARERAEYLRKHVGRVYPHPGFSAYEMLRAAVKGDWSAAANILPCPSDLIS